MLGTVLSLLLLPTVVLCSAIVQPAKYFYKVECDETIAMGECTWDNKCGIGYMCDSVNGLCCPVVDYTDPSWIAGPALEGTCEDGYVVVKIPGGEEGGECVGVESIPGICTHDELNPTLPCEDRWKCAEGFTCFEPANVCCPDDWHGHMVPYSKPTTTADTPSTNEM